MNFSLQIISKISVIDKTSGNFLRVEAASVSASEPTQCLALTRWDFLTALRETDVEMSIIILQELAKRLRRALDSL